MSLEYHPTLLDLMVVLLMVGTIVLMVGSAVLMLGSIVLMVSSAILLMGSIVPMIAMRMIVSMSRSYMLTEPALPVCPGLATIIKQRGTLRRLGNLYLMDARLSLDRMIRLHQNLWLGRDRPFRNMRFVLLVEYLRAPGSHCVERFTWLALLGRSYGHACRAKNEHQRYEN